MMLIATILLMSAAVGAGESVRSRNSRFETDDAPTPALSRSNAEISPNISRLLEVPEVPDANAARLMTSSSPGLFEVVDEDSDEKDGEEEDIEDEDGLTLAAMKTKKQKKNNKNKKKNVVKSGKSNKSSKTKDKSSKSKKTRAKRKKRTKKPTSHPTDVPTTSPVSFSPTHFPTLLEDNFVFVYATSHLVLKVDHEQVTEENTEELKTTALRYLEDDIGGKTTFRTKYVDVVGTAANSEDIIDDKVDVTVFELNVTFTMTEAFAEWVDNEWVDSDDNTDKVWGSYRRLDSRQNRRARYGNLCLSGSVNGKKKKGNRCRNANRRREMRSTATRRRKTKIEDDYDFTNMTFVDAVKNATNLEPESIRSVVNAEHSELLLTCALAQFVLFVGYSDCSKEYHDWFQGKYLRYYCGAYSDNDCAKYTDYLCDDDYYKYWNFDCRDPCYNVDVSPTASPRPTLSPTTTPQAFLFGDSLAFGKEEGTSNTSRPMKVDKAIMTSAAGLGYTILLLDDGTVQVAGHIESLGNYHGHMGLPREDLVEGANQFKTISKVMNDTTGNEITDAPLFTKVHAGVKHSLFIDESGEVWTMGSNSKGQLCLGDFLDRDIPTKVHLAGAVVGAALGGEHTLLLHSDTGSVSVCGSNEEGQLFLSSSVTNASHPVIIPGSGEAHVESISAGLSHSVFLARNRIFVSGSNQYGQLCGNTSGTSVFLGELTNSIISRHEILAFEASMHSSYILFIDGSITGCGRNDYGQLGDGSFDNKVVTSTLSNARIRRLGVGPSSHSALFISFNNEAYATGLNNEGQLGLGDTFNRNYMSKVSFGEDMFVDHLSPARDHSVAGAFSLISPQTLFQWGDAESFGLEEGSIENLIPVEINAVVTDVAAGTRYSIILFEDGTLQATGFIDSMDDYHGHFGLPISEVNAGQNTFQTITQVYDTARDTIIDAPLFKKAYAGTDLRGEIHTIFIDVEGQVWATGSNSKGQLCLGDNEDRYIPSKIPMDGRIISAAIGGQHTLLLHESQKVFVCGSNENGQLGVGENVNELNEATVINGMILVETISAGIDFSLFLSSAHGFVVTGSNAYGQLCAGTGGDSLFYVTQVFIENCPPSSIKSFKAGRSSSYVLLKSGKMITCGRNNAGQLGDGTNVDKNIVALENFTTPIHRVEVGPGSDSAFFIDNDGNAYAVGENDRGQLGVGDILNRNELTRIDLGENMAVQQLSTSEGHTLCRAGAQDKTGSLPGDLDLEAMPQPPLDLGDITSTIRPITDFPNILAAMENPDENSSQTQTYAGAVITFELMIRTEEEN